MKFCVTMKNPDALYDAVREAVTELADEFAGLMDLDNDERDAVVRGRCEKVNALCSRWFKYGECLTVEIDTEVKTCVIVENKSYD